MSGQKFERRLAAYRTAVDRRLTTIFRGKTPRDLNDGCRYILEGGGKRVRSTLVILACQAAGGRWQSAVDAGAAVEILHNFTLVHDDVMDNAPSRRGRPTVHKKWNLNTAILVGDVLVGAAYERLLATPLKDRGPIARLFTDGLLDVCEGQACDLELSGRTEATVRDYFSMIELKTGSLIRMSAMLGGMIGGATKKQIAALGSFGRYLGRAFQLQDDLLDVIADEREFGKKIGGDILEGKKTFLLLRAAELSEGDDRALLDMLIEKKADPGQADAGRLIAVVTDIYRRTGVIDLTRKMIRADTAKAVAALRALPSGDARDMLAGLASSLVSRQS